MYKLIISQNIVKNQDFQPKRTSMQLKMGLKFGSDFISCQPSDISVRFKEMGHIFKLIVCERQLIYLNKNNP